jgi:nucleotide-binding universal stress UspA family protein
MKLIFVPTDFSEPATRALRMASELARESGAHLLVMFADKFELPIDYTTTVAQVAIGSQHLAENALEELHTYTELHVGKDVPFDVRVAISAPVNAILDLVNETGADLIVMGTHGRSGIRRLILGSVTEEIVRMAPVPVLTVNEKVGGGPCVSEFPVKSSKSMETRQSSISGARVSA